jgi:hypothetical protein
LVQYHGLTVFLVETLFSPFCLSAGRDRGDRGRGGSTENPAGHSARGDRRRPRPHPWPADDRPGAGILVAVLYSSWNGLRLIGATTPLQNGEPFPHRELIIILTFFVVLLMLVGQGLMLPISPEIP